MTYELHAVPKPAVREERGRQPLKRTRMKSRNQKRKGSAFPKVRDREYTRWLVTENDCLLRHRTTRKRMSPIDVWTPYGTIHHCWGPIDPAHVGKHRSKGAPDLGATVPLCRAAHSFYDEHRNQWPHVTQLSEKQMASAASGYALKYAESGGLAYTQKEHT
jgi:hypothetical protein